MGDKTANIRLVYLNESDSMVLRVVERAVEAWLRRTTDKFNVQEARHPRLFVSRKAAA
jgi:hypothetical protein